MRPRVRGEPEWWNGRHGGLKIRCSQGREGSNPSSGTTVMSQDMPDGPNPQLGSDRFCFGWVGPLGLPVGW